MSDCIRQGGREEDLHAGEYVGDVGAKQHLAHGNNRTSRHLQYLGDVGEAAGDVGEYLGEVGDS